MSKKYGIAAILVHQPLQLDTNALFSESAIGKDLIGSMRKNNRAARAARTLSQFFDVVCQMTT